MKVDRRSLMIGGGLAFGAAGRGLAQRMSAGKADGAAMAGLTGAVQPDLMIDLWPGTAPGMASVPPAETVRERSSDPGVNDRALLHIARPRLAVFRARNPNGAAMLVMPGGGYSWVVIDKEGYEIGPWLAQRGVSVFVLFYRLPGDGWAAGADVALSDAQRAMRLIRHRAADFGIDPARVGAMGFSAGGHVCADLATRFAMQTYEPVDAADRQAARPFLAAPIYPVVSMYRPDAHEGSRRNLIGESPDAKAQRRHSPHEQATPACPPCFLVHAEDDDVVSVENSLLLRRAWRAQGLSVDMHLFMQGGHGFGLRRAAGKPVAVWPELFARWASGQGLVGA
ncbi:alpha/beta hydrolase [Sphingobium sp.]|uniref:alpha/beta hydrolase n=1 Tax=Sphingobium sp. TaxID=1912891 RepID=UPI00261D7568|nr:alpha/beta hydrolase [Sphingobium sp.]